MCELIKFTFVGDTLESGGNFGTYVSGAKLTVNKNNQSAGLIEHWRQSNEQQREESCSLQAKVDSVMLVINVVLWDFNFQ